MCRNYFNQATMGKQIKKQEKHKKYSRVRKSYSTCRKGIGGCKKKEKISKSETRTLTYFDNLKKKQQDQGNQNWCFISLTISNLRTTAFYFENTKLLKQILSNTMSFVLAKKQVIKHIKTFSNLAK